MSIWYRVFGSHDTEPNPAELAAALHAAGLPVQPHFRGDDLGWTSGELRLTDTTVVLQRFLATADDLRDELNAHAAELEALDQPQSAPLMACVIQSRQVITLRNATTLEAEALLLNTCRYLAEQTAGVYQIDGQGWFDAAGQCLVRDTDSTGTKTSST